MITIMPKAVKVLKSNFITSSTKKTSSTPAIKTAKTRTTKKPNKKVIGLFYNYYKRPLNYLFALLKKPRKKAEEKEVIKDLLNGLRKAEKKFQEDNKFTDSVVDLLINQRSLKLGKLEASFDPALSAAVKMTKAEKGIVGIFYNMHKRPLNYLFALLKKPRKKAEEKEVIKDIMKGLRKAEKSFLKDNNLKDSIVDKLIEQRDLTLGKLEG